MPTEHPPGRCGSVQCARCYNLVDPHKPLYKDREDDAKAAGVVVVSADECRTTIADKLDRLRACHPDEVEALTHAVWLLHGVNL